MPVEDVNKSSTVSAILISTTLADNGLSWSDILDAIRILIEYILSRKRLVEKGKQPFPSPIFIILLRNVESRTQLPEQRSRSPPIMF